MNPYLIVAALVALIGTAIGGFYVGKRYQLSDSLEEKVEQQQAELFIERTLRERVPQIVTKVVTREVEIVKEIPRVIEIIRREVPPDCVLPDGYGRVLVNAARALDGEPALGIDEAAGTYDCREVLEAITKDLAAGKKTSNRLDGLQEFERARLAAVKEAL